MAQRTSYMMEKWYDNLNNIADELENSWSDQLGVQAAEFLRHEAESVRSLISGTQSLEETLTACLYYCDEILSDNPDDTDKKLSKHMKK